MKLTTLEKAAKDLTHIKELDTQISRLEKLAMILATNSCKVSMNLSIDNLTKEEKKENFFDEYGFIKDEFKGEKDFKAEDEKTDPSSIFTAMIESTKRFYTYEGCAKKQTNKEVIECSLSESMSLEVLGVLLYSKQQERKKLIDKLTKIGFEL